MILGCIADDLTGASDLALMLTREGFRTVQCTGVPKNPLKLDGFDAVVVALKSRTIPAADAVKLSLSAFEWLKNAGAQRYFFKYCSTFDSTDQGNIGPVAEALLERLGASFTIACPAFPANGRSIYMGQLFVNGVPLAESSMRDHPLTPMRDSDLKRVLQRQCEGTVGLVSYPDLEGGPSMITKAFGREAESGHRIAIVDALNDQHLRAIGAAAVDLSLITGGSGVAIGLPAAYRDRGLIEDLSPPPMLLDAPAGRGAVLSGSCSVATRGQIAAAISAGMPALKVDPTAVASGRFGVADIMAWLSKIPEDKIPLIYSSDDPKEVKAVQAQLGTAEAGELLERLMGETAIALVESGFSRLIVAGGETSGAVVKALGVELIEIGPEIDVGVPWTRSLLGPKVALALKSGNFGASDFFLKAWGALS